MRVKPAERSASQTPGGAVQTGIAAERGRGGLCVLVCMRVHSQPHPQARPSGAVVTRAPDLGGLGLCGVCGQGICGQGSCGNPAGRGVGGGAAPVPAPPTHSQVLQVLSCGFRTPVVPGPERPEGVELLRSDVTGPVILSLHDVHSHQHQTV